MVLGICRRVLHDPHEIEDAFQATFLILVRRAGTIYGGQVLGTWLYGVARRVALRARANASKRQAHERTAAREADAMNPSEPPVEARELRELIDHELERLPARYRAPVILCDLEGHTHDQAALQLQCPVGTVKSRLSRGREQLRMRLLRRGVAPTAGAIAAVLAAEPGAAAPVSVVHRTVRAAAGMLAGDGAAGALSGEVRALMKGVLRSMVIARLKTGGTILIAVLLAAAGGSAGLATVGAQNSGATQTSGSASAARSKRSATAALEPNDASATLARAISLGPGVTQFELKNGLKVILRPIRGARKTVLMVLYSLGNDHDPAGRSGVAHMLEHVYVTAAAGKEKSRTVEEYLRRYPDGWNAQTGDRYTVFAAVFAPTGLDDELTSAAARMSDLRITDADVDRERPRMLQEVGNMFGGYPPLAAMNNALDALRPIQGGGRRGGLPDHINQIRADDISALWKRYYKPRNAILVVSGQVDVDLVRRQIESHFAGLDAGERALAPSEPDKPRFGAFTSLTVNASVPGANPEICLAYAAPQPGSRSYAPFLVLASRLMAAAPKLGGAPGSFPVYFAMLDNPAVLAVSAATKAGESPKQAVARLEAFVSESIRPPPASWRNRDNPTEPRFPARDGVTTG